jgi:hypothetical protein
MSANTDADEWRIEEPLPTALVQGWVYFWVNGHCFQVLREVAFAILADHNAARWAEDVARPALEQAHGAYIGSSLEVPAGRKLARDVAEVLAAYPQPEKESRP